LADNNGFIDTTSVYGIDRTFFLCFSKKRYLALKKSESKIHGQDPGRWRAGPGYWQIGPRCDQAKVDGQ
jgi:hypothetical protein